MALIANHCEIDDTFFDNFDFDFPLLYTLKLYGCGKINNASLKRISQLFPSLEKLHMSTCSDVTDDGILHFIVLSKLSEFFLLNCYKITNEVADILMAIPNLRRVSLCGCYVSNAAKSNLREFGIRTF